MKIRNSFKDNVIRLVFAFSCLYCLGGSLRYILSRHPFGWGLMVADILFQLLLAFICFSMIFDRPAVELSQEGVRIRRLLKWRFYRWEEFEQAGILWQFGVHRKNDLVLLVPGGSARTYQDKTFQLRNYGKLIHLPCKDRALQYVVSCYGKLDFNLADGKPECED